MENFTETGSNTLIGTPIDSIRAYYGEKSKVVQELKLGETAVSQARMAAIEAAVVPYDHELRNIRSQISQAEALASPQALEALLREQMVNATSLQRAGFELLLARYEIDIPTLITSLTTDGYHGRIITNQLRGIGELEEAAEHDPELLVFYFSLGWFEEEEVSFERHPQKSSEACWVKKLSGTLATLDEISVESEQVTLPDSLTSISKPRSITLRLSGVSKFASLYDWGSLRAEHSQLQYEALQILSVIGRSEPGLGVVDWQASQNQDFSLLREGIHGQILRESDSRVYCIYGYDSVLRAMQQLHQDKSIPEDMKDVLRTSEERLARHT